MIKSPVNIPGLPTSEESPSPQEGFGLSGTVVKTTAKERNVAVTGALTPDTGRLYSLAIFNTSTKSVLEVGDELDPGPGANKYAEFYFGVPPKVVEVEEPFATTIVPTQGGGRFVESHGSIIKTIRVSGTTGLRPYKVTSGLDTIPVFGSGLNSLAKAVGSATGGVLGGPFGDPDQLSDKERTGFDDLIFLRNLFRKYSDLKSNDALASQTVFLWRNAKDLEFWVVEPGDFKVSQDASSPMTYNYQFTLRTLCRFQWALSAPPPDPMAKVKGLMEGVVRINKALTGLRQSFLIVASQANRLSSMGVFLSSSVYGSAISVIQGLSAIKSSYGSITPTIAYNVDRLKGDLERALSDLRNKQANPGVNKAAAGLQEQDPAIRGLSDMLRATLDLHTDPLIKESSIKESQADKSRAQEAYATGGSTATDSRQYPSTGGSKSYLGNETSVGRLAQSVVRANEDIRGAAQRLLGDRQRWQILVVVNSLRAPYIAPVRAPGVLQPGDTILYPARGPGARALVNNVNQSNSESAGDDQNQLGPAQVAYGRDIRLKTSVVNAELSDLEVNQKGDISTIVGVPNVDQAIRIKFSTEQGELAAHPYFGAKFPIGTKLSGVAITDFRIQTEATLFSDPRVASIRSLDFFASGGDLALLADLVLTDQADTLNTSFSLRNS